MFCCDPQVPDINIESVEAAGKDADIVSKLEEHLNDWSASLSSVMQRESGKKPGGKGPLAEIDFWRNRSAVLSGLYEQLNLPHVARIIQVAEAVSDDRNLITAFRSQVAELTKLATEVSSVCINHALNKYMQRLALEGAMCKGKLISHTCKH